MFEPGIFFSSFYDDACSSTITLDTQSYACITLDCDCINVNNRLLQIV